MPGFEALNIIVSHLIGDFLLQSDWQAKNKLNPWPSAPKPKPPWRFGPPPVHRPPYTVDANPSDREGFRKALEVRNELIDEANRQDADIRNKTATYHRELAVWRSVTADQRRAWWVGNLACTIHCVLYTFSVFCFCASWMTWWGDSIVFATHWLIDRFRLARSFMRRNDQEAFATGPFSPWSVIVVDAAMHLLVLVLVAAFTGGC